MTHQERKAIVIADSKLRNLWYLMLLFLGVPILLLIFNYYVIFSNRIGLADIQGLLLTFVMVPLISVTLLQAWILWGAYRLEGWITIWLYIAIVGSIITFNVYNIVLNVAALSIYKTILKKIKDIEASRQVGLQAVPKKPSTNMSSQQ
ncbi:hypothetical protein HOB10_00005 [Candidatus Parcubacteria bacterium]|jgi:hypothetical protein|nr:hypothetical protein [Candidatus Parcubacteria bacterium]